MWKENTNFLCIKAGLTENTVWQNRIWMHGERLAIKYMDNEHSIGHDGSIWSFMISLECNQLSPCYPRILCQWSGRSVPLPDSALRIMCDKCHCHDHLWF